MAVEVTVVVAAAMVKEVAAIVVVAMEVMFSGKVAKNSSYPPPPPPQCHLPPSVNNIMETCSVVLTFESVDEILCRDHSNETSLYGTICCCFFFNILQNEI